MKKLIKNLLKYKSTDDVFSGIYKSRSWNGIESFSGRGSDSDQTIVLKHKLPEVLRELEVKTFLDLPCGDFNWMSEVVCQMTDFDYIGGDIVKELVDANNQKYSSDRVSFQKLNLMTDSLPQADMILCRDCLVHLSESDIRMAIKNILRSRFKFVALTNFPGHSKNKNITTGKWRPLNLSLKPFAFPAAIIDINEGCTEENGRYSDKTLSIFKFEDILKYD